MSDTKTHTSLTAVTPSLGTTRPKGRWRKATLTSLHAVEKLLDELEHAGYGALRLSIAADTFVVRWR